MTLVGFLLIYVFGGLTFFPLLGGIILVIMFPPWTWKIKKDSTIKFDSVLLPDHLNINSTGRDDSSYHKYGWLRVTREFDLPNNGTSNRSSIIGNMMKQGITSFMEGQNNNNKQHLKRTKDSYFAVLKYNTLFMYESEKQLDYKGIIIVSNHDVTIFPEKLLDNEIFTKANSIRLTKKPSICAEMDLESNSCNYYLFCDTGVEKEDWYFALQRSSKLESNDNSTDQPINRDKSLFDSFAMNHLLKTLYSNDDHIHTQWLNAVLGRIFLSVYKTQAVKDYFIRKLVKKIKKVKKPGFLSDIQIKSVDVGDGIPYITNPELVKLSPDGELNVDINLNYTGGFRVEIETEAILSVGVKTIKVPLVLAVVLRGLQGKMLLRIKSPPTNRLWMGFYDMPKLDLLIEPVVSETQLKFGPFIKAIESKIHEMINDSLVLPNMDDTPFFNSFGMGGIYEGEVEQPKQQTDTLTETPPPTPPSALSSTDSEKETSKLIEEEESVVADIRSTLTTNEEVLKSINSSPAILESIKSDDKVEVTINTPNAPNAPNTPNTPNTPNIPNTPNTSNTPNTTENNGPSLSWTTSTATKLKSAFSEPNLLKTNTSRFRSISKQFMKQRADDPSVKDPIKEHVKESDGDINLLSATSNPSSSTTSSTSTLRRWSQSVNIRRRTGIASILNHATYNGKSNNSNNNDNNNKNSDNTTSSTSNSTSNSTESDTQKSQISSMESIPVASLPADPVGSGDNRTTSLLIENFAPLSSSQNISPSSASPTSVVSSTIITTPSINTSKESLALPTYKSSSLSPTSQNDVPKTTTPTPPPSPPKSPKEPPDIQVNSPHSPPHSSSSTRSSKSTSSYNRDLFLSENNSLHDDEFFPDVTPPILNTPVEELNRVLAKGTEGTVN